MNIGATINGFILFSAHQLDRDVPHIFLVWIVVRQRNSPFFLLLTHRPRTDQITIFVAIRDPLCVLLLHCTGVTWEGRYAGPAQGLDWNSQLHARVDMLFNDTALAM